MALNEVASKLAAFYQKLEDEKLNKERFYIKARLQDKIDKIETAIIPLNQKEGKSEKEKQCLAELQDEIRKLNLLTYKLEEKFSIFVIGDGNTGKSTVVNSLLGQSVAKMKFDPMTWKIDVFHEAESGEVQLINYDKKGSQIAVLSEEDAKQLIDEEEAKREESIKKIRNAIKEKTDLLSKVCKAQGVPYREVAEKLEAYKQRVWQEELYTSSIIEARWPVASNEILANFQIVDTPGLRQNRIASPLQESIKKFYDEADGIIWVLDMNKIATNSTKAYIEEIENELFTKGKACDQKRMLALLNRSDCVRTKEERDAILTQAKSMYQEEFNEILPYTATMALEGKLNKDEVLLEQSGYNELDTYIRKYFLQGANEVKTEKTVKEIQKEEIKFQVVVSYYMDELQGRLKEHIASGNKLEGEFEQLERDSLLQLQDMITSYDHTVQARIERFAESLFEAEVDKEHVLREEIFSIDSYQNELKELLLNIAKKIEHLQADYMDKLTLRRINEHPLRASAKKVDLSDYFSFIQDDLGIEKVEGQLIRKLVSGIQAVKKLVDKPHVQQCKEKLLEGLKCALAVLKIDFTEELKQNLMQEKRQILYIRQQRFNEVYGDDSTRINQLYALKSVEKLLSEPTRESTITDYIKGMGEGEWNNTLIN